jgi:hypothetical protein
MSQHNNLDRCYKSGLVNEPQFLRLFLAHNLHELKNNKKVFHIHFQYTKIIITILTLSIVIIKSSEK